MGLIEEELQSDELSLGTQMGYQESAVAGKRQSVADDPIGEEERRYLKWVLRICLESEIETGQSFLNHMAL